MFKRAFSVLQSKKRRPPADEDGDATTSHEAPSSSKSSSAPNRSSRSESNNIGTRSSRGGTGGKSKKSKEQVKRDISSAVARAKVNNKGTTSEIERGGKEGESSANAHHDAVHEGSRKGRRLRGERPKPMSSSSSSSSSSATSSSTSSSSSSSRRRRRRGGGSRRTSLSKGAESTVSNTLATENNLQKRVERREKERDGTTGNHRTEKVNYSGGETSGREGGGVNTTEITAFAVDDGEVNDMRDEHLFEQVVSQQAKLLGMDPVRDKKYFWIAVKSLEAPLPTGWKRAKSKGDAPAYYYNKKTKTSQWEHPLDGYYRSMFERVKAETEEKERRERMEESVDQLEISSDFDSSIDSNDIFTLEKTRRRRAIDGHGSPSERASSAAVRRNSRRRERERGDESESQDESQDERRENEGGNPSDNESESETGSESSGARRRGGDGKKGTNGRAGRESEEDYDDWDSDTSSESETERREESLRSNHSDLSSKRQEKRKQKSKEEASNVLIDSENKPETDKSEIESGNVVMKGEKERMMGGVEIESPGGSGRDKTEEQSQQEIGRKREREDEGQRTGLTAKENEEQCENKNYGKEGQEREGNEDKGRKDKKGKTRTTTTARSPIPTSTSLSPSSSPSGELSRLHSLQSLHESLTLDFEQSRKENKSLRSHLEKAEGNISEMKGKIEGLEGEVESTQMLLDQALVKLKDLRRKQPIERETQAQALDEARKEAIQSLKVSLWLRSLSVCLSLSIYL